MRLRLVAFFLLMVPSILPTHADAGDAGRGAIVAQVRCLACHHLDSEWASIGPGLKGIYGRTPTISGVPFSVWDAAALEAWLRGPRNIKPNTRMRIPPMAVRDRADLIAYFKRDAARLKSKTLSAKDVKNLTLHSRNQKP